MGVRFLHTADWHLGKAFNNLGPEAGARLRLARIEAVRRIAAIATERQVDAVLVAGDVFDQQVASIEVITGCLGAMEGFAGDWVLLPGNHDAAEVGSVWERVRLRLPEGRQTHLATGANPVQLANGRLAVLPAPLLRRHESSDLTAIWDNSPTPPAACRVGLAHGSVLGILPEAAEKHNPIAADRAGAAHLDYLALGDWHGTLQVGDRAWYSGTPEPDGFKENDSGNVLLIEMDGSGAAPRVEPIPTGQYRWLAWERRVTSRGDIEQLDRDLDAERPANARVVWLRLEGMLALPDTQILRERLDWWRGQFAVLRAEGEKIQVSTGDTDFAALQPPGFVAKAVADLQSRDKAGEPGAAEALTILYQLCVDAGAGA